MNYSRCASQAARIACRTMVLAFTASAGPLPLLAQESEARHSKLGTLLGAGVGVAVGFGLAGATDYPLKEGGALVVTYVGAALGAAAGYKLSASAGQPWSPPPRVQVAVSWGVGWSGASGDLESAFSGSSGGGLESHHALVPALTMMVDARGPVRIGAEISGLRAAEVRSENELASLLEYVEGWALSALVLFGTRPTANRRLMYSAGGGLDWHAVTAASYFDFDEGTGLLPPYEAQPRRSARVEAKGWGPQLRAGLEFYVTPDVSLNLYAIRRWKDPITIPGIALIDEQKVAVEYHEAHSVSLGSFHLSFGVGMRF